VAVGRPTGSLQCPYPRRATSHHRWPPAAAPLEHLRPPPAAMSVPSPLRVRPHCPTTQRRSSPPFKLVPSFPSGFLFSSRANPTPPYSTSFFHVKVVETKHPSLPPSPTVPFDRSPAGVRHQARRIWSHRAVVCPISVSTATLRFPSMLAGASLSLRRLCVAGSLNRRCRPLERLAAIDSRRTSPWTDPLGEPPPPRSCPAGSPCSIDTQTITRMDLIHCRAGDECAAALLKCAVTVCRLCPARPTGTGRFRPSGPRLGQAEQAAGLQVR
jgi:hypothetical protein